MSRLALLAALLAWAAPAAKGKVAPMQGSYCAVSEPGHRVVESAAAWKKIWQELGRPAPPADFAKQFAVAVFAGERPSGGWGIVFEEPAAEGQALVVRYRVTPPKGMATMAFTQPYAVRMFDRRAGLTPRAEATQ